MGLFDEITCAAPLPHGYEFMQDRVFQTKSLGCGMDFYRITDSAIVKEKSWPSGHYGEVKLDSDVTFYDFADASDYRSMVIFRARFDGGRLVDIKLVSDGRMAG